MSTYLELKKQAEALMAQAEAARQQEIASAIGQIREIMTQYGITLEDLGARSAPAGGGRAGGGVRGGAGSRPASCSQIIAVLR